MNRNAQIQPANVMVFCGILLAPIYILPQDVLMETIGARPLTVLAAAIGLIYGTAVLQIIWRIEKRDGRGTILFAWCYFVIQHMAFGFGALLESTFDLNYWYTNSQGTFPFNEAILPLLKVHLVSMTVGILGVWLATRSGENNRGVGVRRRILPKTGWSWERLRFACFSLLFLHALLDVIAPELKLTGLSGYVLVAIAAPPNAAPFLWGLTWQGCTKKWVFLTYYGCFGVFQVIRGGRTAFVSAAVLFVLGFILSGAAGKVRFRTYVKVSVLSLLLAWAFVVSDNVRTLFSRGTPGSADEAIQRVESIGNSDTDAISREDGLGVQLNAPFRFASRIFEASAADVVLRTPDAVPFWGWEFEDWRVFWTSAFPLGLNKDAAFFTSERNGMFYLRSYGWFIDPFGEERGVATSMPATLVGDSWRRSGWLGVVGCFLVLSWLLARMTCLLRFRADQIGRAVFSSALLAEVILWYGSDIIYLAASLPRRFLLMAAYAVTFSAFLSLKREQKTSLRSRVIADSHSISVEA